ncbi:hypothetical protein [Eastern grey kangaroopox virus]|uniref:Uncharacterized protein n=1 Tax=Eastern grey kangaroopox virus TaxID=2042482 RepID=A0A2C9DTB0_9POXV|nr:hypothetical protein KM541_gp147 [Eastern grey kangaroopox virus]ATI21243.1 hypothetical protein [Eastern grey kangaroopox virus]ATX75152.2 hypothetical protein EKPV-NSW-ORF163 [Eastern grey kangaroopox virus]
MILRYIISLAMASALQTKRRSATYLHASPETEIAYSRSSRTAKYVPPLPASTISPRMMVPGSSISRTTSSDPKGLQIRTTFLPRRISVPENISRHRIIFQLSRYMIPAGSSTPR